MKVNRVRRIFEIIAASIAVLLGIMEVVFGIIAIIQFGNVVSILVGSIIDILLGASIICIGSCLFPEAELDEGGNPKDRLGIVIALIVVNAILLAFIIYVLSAAVNIGLATILELIACVMIFPLLIAIICLPTLSSKKDKSQNHTNVNSQSNENELLTKLQELKKIKDLSVLTEEQYNEAVEKIIQEYKKTV